MICAMTGISTEKTNYQRLCEIEAAAIKKFDIANLDGDVWVDGYSLDHIQSLINDGWSNDQIIYFIGRGIAHAKAEKEFCNKHAWPDMPCTPYLAQIVK